MTNANYRRIQIRKRPESTYKVLDDAAGPQILNLNAEDGLESRPVTTRLAIARDDRQMGHSRRVGASAEGPIAHDVILGAQLAQEFVEALHSDWSSDLNISGTTISFTASDNSLNGSGSEFANVVAGQWIVILGASTAANNTDGASGRPPGCQVLTKVSDAKIIVRYHTLTDEVAGATVTVKGSYIREGTTLKSVTVEKEHLDMTSGERVETFLGQVVNTFGINVTLEQLVKITLNYIGPRHSTPTETSAFSNSPVAAEGQTDAIDGANNVIAFREGGTLVGQFRSFQVNGNNNAEVIKVAGVGQDNVVGVSLGGVAFDGSLDAYLVDGDGRRMVAFNHTAQDFHLMFVSDDTATDVWVLSIFRAKYTNFGNTTKSQEQGPVPQNMPFEAEFDSNFGDKCFQVSRLPRS